MQDTSSQVEKSKTSVRVKTDQNILTVAKGGSIVFAGGAFEYGVRFVMGILLARLLGAEQLGMYNLALTAATVASGLALLGLRSAMVRFVSLAIGRRDEAGLWGTLQVGLGLTTLVSLLMGGGLYVLAHPIAAQLFHEPRLAPLLRLVSVIVPLMALNEIFAAATRGFKKMQYTVVAQNIYQHIVRLILIVVLAVVGLNATNALVAFGLATVVVFVLLLYFLNKLFSLKRPIKKARREIKEIVKFSLPLYLSDLLSTFGGNVQTVLLGAWNTVTTVGVFTVATHVNLVGRMFHLSIVTASMPIVSDLYDQADREQLRRFYQTMTKWTFMVNLPIFLILVLFPDLILSVFGQSFVGGATALTILAWGNLVNVGTGICGVLLDMSGNTHFKLVNTLVTIALTLGLNILFIPRLGLVGAAIASAASAVAVNLLRLVEVYMLFRLLPYDLRFLKPIAAGLVALAATMGTRRLLPVEGGLVYPLTSMVVLLLVYGGSILVLGLSQEDRAVLVRLRGRLGAVLSR